MGFFIKAKTALGYHHIERTGPIRLTPADKVERQAVKQLGLLDGVANIAELEKKLSSTSWISQKPTSSGKQRRLCMKYNSRVVPETDLYVDNTLEAIRAGLKDLRAMAADAPMDVWVEEEARRNGGDQ